MDSVRRITENIEKPDLDDRSYRIIELPNKLEALLVHDPKTDKSSASLNVGVGNFSDDESMPGMAHAVEHLLFMGTEKYPVENEYSSYLSSNSGYSNAYTAATQTNYFFECAAVNESSEHTTNGTNGLTNGAANGVVNGTANGTIRGPLYGAMDRFSQFFVKPLFLENTLDRELQAVDSENKKNLQSDPWRLSQLAKSLSNPKHPYHHFSTGNLQTLKEEPEKRGVKIRDEFIKFYEKHYSANRMKLVVLGREPLDELETWVAELFSEVANKDLPQNRWDDVPALSREELGTEIFAKPVMESRSLEISFPWQDEEEMYETQPSRYVSHLIGHEGPGSILSYLKEQGLANSLSSGMHPVCPGSAFFEIEIGLTPEGGKRYHEVAKIVFQYIGLIKEQPPAEWMFEEMKNMAEVDFKFKQKSPATRFTSNTSAVMQKPLPRKWLLSGLSKVRRFDPEAISRAMQFLREDNFRLMLVSHDYPGDWNQKEQWYGTDYKVEKIPTDVQSEIRKALSSPSERPSGLYLPHKNEFIPTRLDVEKLEVAEPAKVPKLLRNDGSVRLWWKKDDSFWVPKANINITLRSPLNYATPANQVKTTLFLNLVKDALTTYAYDAELAGLNYSLHATMLGLDLSIHGYNDKSAVLLEKVLVTIRDLEISSERFDIIKERLSRKYKNWDFQQPYTQIGDFSRWLINETSWMNPQYMAELPHITVEDIRAFAPQLIQQAHIELLAHGNLYKEEAKRIGNLIENTLKPRMLPKSQWRLRRNVIIPPGGNYVYEYNLRDPENVNHAIEYYLHVGPTMELGLRAKLQLFAQIAEEPAFDQLRTKEQLGYVVFSGVKPSATTMGYRVLIQSERDSKYLETRIDAFLLYMKRQLENMSQEDFDKHKSSLITRRLEKLKNLESETARLWAYINNEYFNFYQIDTDVAAIRKLRLDDVKQFFAQYIDPEASSRAKLAVHLIANKKPSKVEEDPTEQRDTLVELLGQYVAQLGVADTDVVALKKKFVDVAPSDKEAVLAALKVYIEPRAQKNQLDEVMTQITQQLPDMMIALKIQPPVANGNADVAIKVAPPVVIEDVDSWKAGLQVSCGPVAVTDLAEFEDFEAKL